MFRRTRVRVLLPSKWGSNRWCCGTDRRVLCRGMRTGVRIERPEKRGNPTPFGGHSPRPFGPRGECTTRNCAAPTYFGTPHVTRLRRCCVDRAAGRRFGAPFVDSPRRHRDRVDRRTDPAGIARGEASHTRARTCSPQRSNHRRNARNSTAHSTADSSALRRGSVTADSSALRRGSATAVRSAAAGGSAAAPAPFRHRAANTADTANESPGCLLRHGVRCGTHRVSVSGARTAGIRGSPGCSTWGTDRLGTIRRTRRSEVIHIPR